MNKILEGLKNIDVDKRIEELEKSIKDEKSILKADKMISQLKILRSLKRQNMDPYTAFTKQKLPVIPAQYRAPIETLDGKMLIPEVNLLIRNVAKAADEYERAKDTLPQEEVNRIGRYLYKTVEDLSGFEKPKLQKGVERNLWTTIAGKGTPKGGLFQSKVIRKRQNLTGRGVIVPDPQLDIDEVSVPRYIGYEMYKPFVVRELVRMGKGAAEARKMIDNDDPLARNALMNVGKERPLFINRAPSIWPTSITAHYPIFKDGDVIGIPNLTAPQLLGDFDGDSAICNVKIRQTSTREERIKYRLTEMWTMVVMVLTKKNRRNHELSCNRQQKNRNG